MMNRRRLLKLLSAGGLGGLSGCSSFSPTESNSKSPSTSPTGTTITASPTERSSETVDEPTATQTREDEFSIDPFRHEKLAGAHYYPWYQGKEGIPGFTSSGWLSATPGHPILGEYESQNIDVINQHIKWAIEHGINGFIIGGMFQEENFKYLDSEYSNLIWYIAEEGVPPKNTDLWDNYTEDPSGYWAHRLEHLDRVHFPREEYLRIGPNDRPVFYIFATGTAGDELIPALVDARKSISEDVYVIGDFNFWKEPGLIGSNIHSATEISKAFDAANTYLPYHPFLLQRRTELLDKPTFIEQFERRLRHWRIAADEFGFDFIPTVFPGFDKTEAGSRAVDWPVFERSPEFFQELLDVSLKYIDNSIDAVFITSFNEWPEYTAIEPGKNYGEIYLNIFKERIDRVASTSFNPATNPRLTFDFNKTVAPSEVSSDLEDDRQLAMSLSRLEFIDIDGQSFRSYDVGEWNDEPVFLTGAWGFATLDGETHRWLGGNSKRTIIALHPEVSNAHELIFEGKPQVSNEITVNLNFDGENLGTVDLGKRREQVNTYRIEM